MKYSERPALDHVYASLAEMLEPADPNRAQPKLAMTIASALAELGEDRSWASVWWAYGAVRHDLSDSALEQAFQLLDRVERPKEARAAALMLRAQVRYSQAVYAEATPDASEQHALLQEAVELAPGWPELRVRLARACKTIGDELAAKEHAARAVELLAEVAPTDDPFDAAISGLSLDRAYVTKELEGLGLLATP